MDDKKNVKLMTMVLLNVINFGLVAFWSFDGAIMPLFLMRYTPKTGKLENLGRGAPDNGEAYSIGHLGGKLYYANYPSGNLMCYDPAKPSLSPGPT